MFHSSVLTARVILAAVFLSLFSISSLFSHAQAGPVLGSISGTVVDPTGAAVADAQVTIVSPDKTAVREATTSGGGNFTIGGLPSGTYEMDAVAAGFAAYRNGSIVVAVGRDSYIDVRLAHAQANQQVVVSAQTQALDPSQTSPVTNIDRDRIEELPIPSRNYLSFTLLSPSLTAANPALRQQAPSLGEGGFSAGGLRPSSNALSIDGVDDNDEYTGLSRTELSPEAISDFQVVNHGYAAEYGGSAGGTVDVETRSGMNVRHGDAFLFVQNGALNGTPPLERVPRKPDENRLRAGLSTGGPVRQSKLFYYIAGEQEFARGEDASDIGPQSIALINNAVQRAGPLRGFSIREGFFPTTNQEAELSGRTDYSSGKSAFMLRYALTNNRAVNDAFNTDDLSDATARGSAFFDDNSVNGTWSNTVSSKLLNQLSFEAAQRRVTLRTGSSSGPGVLVAGIAQFGTPFAGNQKRFETHFDAADGLIRQGGKHLFGSGVSIESVNLRAANLDGFAGLYVFQDLNALASGQTSFYIQSFGDPDSNFGEIRSAAYIQDHWTPLKGVVIDYGLRYEYNHLPGSLPQDASNLSPRFGVAWSPDKNWVVRIGFGIFYDRYLLSTVNRLREFDGVHAFQQFAEEDAATGLYRSGLKPSLPLPGIAPSIWRPQSGLANPYSETASLDVERQLPSQWTLSAEYRFASGVKMGRAVNSNLPEPVTLTSANAAELGVSAPTAQQLGRRVFPSSRLDPAHDTVNQFQTEASSDYNGVTLTVNRQFNEEFELMAGYTFSKTMDDASYDTEQPEDPYSLPAERALSLEDQRHRVVLSGLWVLGPDVDDPQDAASAGRQDLLQKALIGLEFAPILTVDNGFRDNPLTGADSNLEHIYPFAARPLGLARNSMSTLVNVNLDLRVLKMIPIWRGHLDVVAESFNLFNHSNVLLVNPVYGTYAAAGQQFGKPIENSDARRIQFSLDFEY